MEEPNDYPTTVSAVDEIIPYVEEIVDPSKTGNKPKQLVAIEVFGYEVGRGNRKRIVNPDDVYKLAALGCNNKEIATWFDINKDTLQYTFGDIIEKAREDLKMRLRQAQLKLALGGNAVMLIWLGKQILGQTDQPINTESNAPLPFNDEGL
jgi:hypothetical protein